MPLNAIQPNEYEMIDYYRHIYFSQHKPVVAEADLRDVLQTWASAKSGLFLDFGKQLILKKPFSYDGSELIETRYYEALNGQDNPIHDLMEKVEHVLWLEDTPISLISQISITIFTPKGYIEENIYYEHKGIEIVNLRKGTKAIKAMRTMFKGWMRNEITDSKILDMLQEYEHLYSIILSNCTIKGNLCLSIHPLDFLTMSDNVSHWTTCTSIQTEGGSRIGTIEMMNSPYIIVAYIEDTKSKMVIGEDVWNNKMWRELLFITTEFITNIKAYPYRCEDFSRAALEFFSEVYDNAYHDIGYEFKQEVGPISSEFVKTYKGNWSIERKDLKIECPDYTHFVFQPCTLSMFNDFFTDDTKHLVFFSGVKPREDWKCILYSGATQCLWCGKDIKYINDFDRRNLKGEMICDDCLGTMYCAECNERVYPDEAIMLNGKIYCDSCTEYLSSESPEICF